MRTWLPSRRYRRRPLPAGAAGRVYHAARRAGFPAVALPPPRPGLGVPAAPSGFAIAAGAMGWRRFLLTASALDLERAARVLAACEKSGGADQAATEDDSA